MLRATTFLVLLLGLTACGVMENKSNRRVTFEGIDHNAKVSGGDDPRDFTVTVRPVSVNSDAAREAGRYEAVKYCIRNLGSSDMEWRIGPDTPIQQVPITDDTLTFVGRCTKRA